MNQPFSRNSSCPCGSGRKYKRCCWDDDHGPLPTFTFEVTGPTSRLSPDTPKGRAALMAHKRLLMELWLDAENENLARLTPRQAALDLCWHSGLAAELKRMQTIEDTIVHPPVRMDLGFLWDALGLPRPSVAMPA